MLRVTQREPRPLRGAPPASLDLTSLATDESPRKPGRGVAPSFPHGSVMPRARKARASNVGPIFGMQNSRGTIVKIEINREPSLRISGESLETDSPE